MAAGAVLEARASNLPPQLVAALKWLATTAGVTGVLLVIGFIIEFAYQDRLGYSVSSEEPAGYCAEAGRFLLALIIILQRSIVGHGAITFITLVIFAGFGYLWLRRPHLLPKGIALLVILAVSLVTDLVVFDLPTVSLKSALILPVTEPSGFGTNSPIGSLTRRVWLDEVCSRLNSPEQVAQFRSFRGECTTIGEARDQRRRDRFALNTLLTAILVLSSISALIGAPRPRDRYLLSAFVLLLVVFDVLMLPFTYAKTVKPTEVDDVKISWINPEVQKNFDAQADFFLLIKNKNEVGIVDREGGEVWIVPAAQARLFQIVAREDVLTFVIRRKLGGVSDGEEHP